MRMTEIWVPYGPVEVSFDVKQENLSEILEPKPAKIAQEELDIAADKVSAETVIVLSGTPGALKFLDTLLKRNKTIRKIAHPKAIGAFCRRKAQEFSIQSEQIEPGQRLATKGTSQNDPAQIISPFFPQGGILISSVHNDPLFGLSSSASETLRLFPDIESRVFAEFADELPVTSESASASNFALNQFEPISNITSIELVEKAGTGLVGLAVGDVRRAHSKSLEIWKNILAIPTQKSERVIFGCGGGENDRNLTDAFARALFPILANVAMADSDSKICMLAECASGLGSEAFLRFVTGRLEPRSRIGGVDYIAGLEVLLSFLKLQEDFGLNILTTLPKFYASKFDLKTIGGAREAPASLLQPGSRAKILVVPDASSSFFKV